MGPEDELSLEDELARVVAFERAPRIKVDCATPSEYGTFGDGTRCARFDDGSVILLRD